MNPAIQKLGYGPADRVVIIHADDIGMCQATLPAVVELFDFGVLSSAAVMVPCPWFPQVAAFCREHPDVDMGVHLTLNAEWAAYRWGPISTRDPASGLLDAAGYFHAGTRETIAHADPWAVGQEARAQVAQARAAGIDATHVDTHMGTIARPAFLSTYVDVAIEARLPLLFLGDASGLQAMQTSSGDPASARQLAQGLTARGYPLFDALTMLPLDDPADHVAVAKRMIDALSPGLTLLILHPAVDTPELRALAPDWRCRVANYQACLSGELREHLRASGVQVIGYRPLRDLVRGQDRKREA